jgi:hypothetical protein
VKTARFQAAQKTPGGVLHRTLDMNVKGVKHTWPSEPDPDCRGCSVRFGLYDEDVRSSMPVVTKACNYEDGKLWYCYKSTDLTRSPRIRVEFYRP